MAPKLENITMEIKDFLGIAYQVVTFGPDGIVATGSNGIGKTTIERAWDAATLGFDAEDIALGAELGRVVISAGDFSLTRQVKRNGAEKVTVSEDGGKSEWKQAQTRINEMFGRTLKPLAFMHADKKAQLQMVKEACPAGEITTEDVERWIGDVDAELIKGIALPKIEGRDGLEAVEDLRDVFYDARKDANAEVKKKAEDLKTAEHNAKAAHDAIPSGVTIMPLDQAKKELASAASAHDALVTRGKQAEEQAAKMAGTRERIAKLRAEADVIDNAESNVPTDHQIELLESDTRRVTERIAELEKAIAVERNELAAMAKTRALYAERIAKHDADGDKMEKLRAQANDLESSLAAVAITPVTPEELTAAAIRAQEADSAHSLAIYGKQCVNLAISASVAKTNHAVAKAKAEALDKVVTTLTEVAPKELIERSGGIPGMAITDEGVTLDGKVYANLCGKEQMFFAVELTKRARRGKVKVIPVDSLETLDEEARVEFIRAAVDGGWKIVGTLVTGGPLTIIELDTAKEIPETITPIKTLEKKLAEVAK